MGIENRSSQLSQGVETKQVKPLSGHEPIVILSIDGVLRRASPKIEERKRLAEWGSEAGYLDTLPERQRLIIEERYGEEGLVLSFEVLAERHGVNLTRQAFQDADRRGIRRLQGVRLKVLYADPEKSGADIAAEIGCSRVTVYKRLKKEGVPVGRKRGRARKPISSGTIRDMYWNQGLSPREIGSEFGGLSRQTIWKRMVLAGIERRSRKASRKKFVA